MLHLYKQIKSTLPLTGTPFSLFNTLPWTEYPVTLKCVPVVTCPLTTVTVKTFGSISYLNTVLFLKKIFDLNNDIEIWYKFTQTWSIQIHALDVVNGHWVLAFREWKQSKWHPWHEIRLASILDLCLSWGIVKKSSLRNIRIIKIEKKSKNHTKNRKKI